MAERQSSRPGAIAASSLRGSEAPASALSIEELRARIKGSPLGATPTDDSSTEPAPEAVALDPGRVRRTSLRPGPVDSDLRDETKGLAPVRSTPPRASLPPALLKPQPIISVAGSNVPASSLPPRAREPDWSIESLDLEVVSEPTPPEVTPTPPEVTPPPPEAHAARPPQRKSRAMRRAAPPAESPRPPVAAAKPRNAEEAPKQRWWEELFSGEFLRAIPILSPAQLEREVRFIQKSLELSPGSRVLDLACGAGQHAVELAARGYDIVGFDQSSSQLSWAGALARERGQPVVFQHGDVRELSYEGEFDAIYCWNTSFGFFEEERNIDVARRMFRALKPGGKLLLDVINRDYVFRDQPSQIWFQGDGCVCIDEVRVDTITSRLIVKRTLMLSGGSVRECPYSIRVYSLHELGKLLHDVGFKVLQASGRTESPGVFFGAHSPRVIILGSRPTSPA